MSRWSSWGRPCRNSRIAESQRGGGVFSDDGKVYLCPKCLAVHDEYFRIMAKIDADRKSLTENDGLGEGPTA